MLRFPSQRTDLPACNDRPLCLNCGHHRHFRLGTACYPDNGCFLPCSIPPGHRAMKILCTGDQNQKSDRSDSICSLRHRIRPHRTIPLQNGIPPHFSLWNHSGRTLNNRCNTQPHRSHPLQPCTCSSWICICRRDRKNRNLCNTQPYRNRPMQPCTRSSWICIC